MQNYNLELFSLLNAGANLSPFALLAATVLARYCVYVVPLWMITCWLFGAKKYRDTLIFAVVAASIAMLINFLIGLFWFQPRPFMLGVGHTFFHHATNSSFPSDHVSFIWAVGLSLILKSGLRTLGYLFLLLAVAVGWARIFLGVHFPLDILGGILTGSVAVGITYCFYSLVKGGAQVNKELFTKI